MRSFRTAWIAILLAGIWLAWSSLARADALADLEHARSDYDAGRYAQAADRFLAMIDPGKGTARSDPVLLEQAKIYYAACLIALNQTVEADKEIREILLTNSSAKPDPVVFPRVVVDRFIDVKSKIRKELEDKAAADAKRKRDEEEKARLAREASKLRLKQLEALAREEVHVVHNSRWIALIPFGVGQFQNNQTAAGWLFLSAETALATTSIVTAVIKSSLESRGFGAQVDEDLLNSKRDTVVLVNRISFAALAAVMVGGVVHAQLTFVPEFRTKKERPLPPLPLPAPGPTVAPSVSLIPSGGLLGLQGRF